MSSMKAFLSPSYFVLAGPERCLDASTLSFFSEERQRAKTASPGEGGRREDVGEEEREGGKQGRRKVGRREEGKRQDGRQRGGKKEEGKEETK